MSVFPATATKFKKKAKPYPSVGPDMNSFEAKLFGLTTIKTNFSTSVILDEVQFFTQLEEEEKENNMERFEETLEGKQQSYLTRRADSEYYSKEGSLQKTFGLRDDDTPMTAQALVDRIKTGMYVLDEKDGKRVTSPMWSVESIRWRDPSKKEDLAGYDTAMGKLKLMLKDTKDAIILGTPETALGKIKEIEAFTG